MLCKKCAKFHVSKQHCIWLFWDQESLKKPKIIKTTTQPSKRLTSLGIMAAQLGVLLKPFEYHGTMVPRGLRGALNLSSITPRQESLLDSRNKTLQSGTEVLHYAEFPIYINIRIYPKKKYTYMYHKKTYMYIYISQEKKIYISREKICIHIYISQENIYI